MARFSLNINTLDIDLIPEFSC